MDLKTILVHMDTAEDHRRQRLATAIDIAAANQAHLIGLFVAGLPMLPTYSGAEIPAVWIEQQQAWLDDNAAAAEAEFNEATQRAGLSAEWRVEHGQTGDALELHMRYTDLTVVGQPDPGEVSTPTYVLEQVLLESGRPALIVPYIGAPKTLGERVLVAWSATREATRAVHDALPFLTRAKSVTVLSINPEDAPERHGDAPSADISLFLARHNVHVEAAEAHARDVDVGDVILSRASDLGADLLVMGAYGHSRLRELVFGGATRTILEHMTIPVLMSH